MKIKTLLTPVAIFTLFIGHLSAEENSPKIQANTTASTVAKSNKKDERTHRISIIRNKLDNITIPKIELEGATIKEAISLLRLKSIALDHTTDDPKHKGINFILLSKNDKKGNPTNHYTETISLNLQNTSLASALDQFKNPK